MGFLFRMRLASFFVGAASASNAGFCLLDKVICSPTTPSRSRQEASMKILMNAVKALHRHVIALENHKETEASKPAEASD